MKERIVFKKAVKVKLTAGRIAAFKCPQDKSQVFLWSNDPVGLAVRATLNGAKSYIFQAKVKGKSMRVTIGDIKAWSISDVQIEARRLQVLIDQGYDPRHVKAEMEAAQKESVLAKKSQQTREVTLAIAPVEKKVSITKLDKVFDAWENWSNEWQAKSDYLR